jgi:endonuclease G
MNLGAWLRTEEITECYRDIGPLHVVGGVIWGFNPDDDFFLTSHKIATPDYYWKVVIAEEQAIGWIIPNSSVALKSRLDAYIVDIATIERITGEDFAIPESFKIKRYTRSWEIPAGCDLS